MESEELLPASIKERVVLSGNEWGWRSDDVLDVLEAADKIGLANLGGQVQFVFADGTCELYWLNIDPKERSESEEWAHFAKRSIAESRENFLRLSNSTNFVDEGIENFKFLKRKAQEPGVDLSRSLIFILYFISEEEYAQLGVKKRR